MPGGRLSVSIFTSQRFCKCLSSAPSSGHWRLKRSTLGEREEQRKRDRDLDRQLVPRKKEKDGVGKEEEEDRTGYCKYTLGIKHQVTNSHDLQTI